MAKNFVQEGRYLFLTVGAGVVSGSPVAVGDITGVTTIDADANNQATVDTEGVYDLSVEANDGGASQVDPGDAIYYNAADTPKLNKKVAGVLYGYALETIAAAGTDTINVKLAKK